MPATGPEAGVSSHDPVVCTRVSYMGSGMAWNPHVQVNGSPCLRPDHLCGQTRIHATLSQQDKDLFLCTSAKPLTALHRQHCILVPEQALVPLCRHIWCSRWTVDPLTCPTGQSSSPACDSQGSGVGPRCCKTSRRTLPVPRSISRSP
jgi:hypothetical protein